LCIYKIILNEKYKINNDFKIKIINYDVTNNSKISKYIKEDWILINTLPFWFKANLPKKPLLDEDFVSIKDKIKLYFDIVYDMDKWDTPLTCDFKKCNIVTCNWIDMVIFQALKGYKLWTRWEEMNYDILIKLLK